MSSLVHTEANYAGNPYPPNSDRSKATPYIWSARGATNDDSAFEMHGTARGGQRAPVNAGIDTKSGEKTMPKTPFWKAHGRAGQGQERLGSDSESIEPVLPVKGDRDFS